jgi:hypothetical protein
LLDSLVAALVDKGQAAGDDGSRRAFDFISLFSLLGELKEMCMTPSQIRSAPRFAAWLAVLMVLAAAFALAGCGGDKMAEIVDKAKAEASLGAEKMKEAVADTSAQVSESVGAASAGAQEQLSLAGKMELTVGEPVVTNACYALFVSQGDGRPSVLQLRSYKQAEQESFPSVFIQAQTSAGSASELVGQTLPAEMYVARVANGAIQCTPPGSFVQIKVTAADDNTLSAELVDGALQSTDTPGETPVTGTLSGVIER